MSSNQIRNKMQLKYGGRAYYCTGSVQSVLCYSPAAIGKRQKRGES
jgi:hypothetical protein